MSFTIGQAVTVKPAEFDSDDYRGVWFYAGPQGPDNAFLAKRAPNARFGDYDIIMHNSRIADPNAPEFMAKELDAFGSPIWRIAVRARDGADWMAVIGAPDFPNKDEADRYCRRLATNPQARKDVGL